MMMVVVMFRCRVLSVEFRVSYRGPISVLMVVMPMMMMPMLMLMSMFMFMTATDVAILLKMLFHVLFILYFFFFNRWT